MPRTPPEQGARFVLLARQAGTAKAFGPLADALEAAGEAVQLAAMGTARETWAERHPLTGEGFADIASELSGLPPDAVLVTGTSASPEDDARSWAWARDRGLRTVAFVDSWVNYGARFETSSGEWVVPLPDVIACPDGLAAKGLVDAGLPADRIVALGSPAFDGLVERIQPMPSRDQGVNIVFASQPLAGRGLPRAWDEHRALALLLDALAESDLGVVTVRVRLHPAEPEGKFTDVATTAPGVLITRDTEPDRALSVGRAHLVVGIATMLLVEARWLGRPAISVQPGEPVPSDLVDGHGIPVASTVSSLVRALRDGLGRVHPLPAAPSSSIERWIGFLHRDPAR